MKAVAINGSPRKGGNTEILLKKALAPLAAAYGYDKVVFGLIMLYSASFDFSFNEYGSSSYMFNRQVKWLGLGILCAMALTMFDYHHWRRLVVFAMLGTICLLVAVLAQPPSSASAAARPPAARTERRNISRRDKLNSKPCSFISLPRFIPSILSGPPRVSPACASCPAR